MRKTIIMIIIGAALAAYVYFYEIKGGEEREQVKAASEKLIALEKDSIRVVHIKSLFSEFEFQKGSDGWRITQPVNTGADESTISTLLSGLVNAKKERSFAISPEERGNFGLDQRALQLELKTVPGEKTNVQFGEAASIGSNVYVSLGDSMVHLVASSVKNNASKSLFEWRDKKVLHFDKNEVRELHIRGASAPIELIKEGDDWKIQKPFETDADKSVVNGVLDKLKYGKIKAVASESDTDFKKYIKNKTLNIELIVGADKAKKELVFSELNNNVAYGKDASRPHIFQVDSIFMKPLLKTLFDFRDKSLVHFEQNQSTRIQSVFKGIKVELEKDTSGVWYSVDSLKAKSWKISSMLSGLSGLKASAFNIPKKYADFQNPDGLLQVFSGNEPIAELAVIQKDQETAYVYNRISGLKAEIRASNLEKLFPPSADLFEKLKQEETK